MDSKETKFFISWLLRFYPTTRLERMDNGDFAFQEQWALELEKYKPERVFSAAREAMMDTPSFFPPLPLIQKYLNEQSNRIHCRSPEQQYKDLHGGRTPEQEKKLQEWLSSPACKQAWDEARERAKKILKEAEQRGV